MNTTHTVNIKQRVHYYCVSVQYMCEGCMPYCACGGQRPPLWSWFSPSTFTWVWEIELGLPDFCGKRCDPLSILTGPWSPFHIPMAVPNDTGVLQVKLSLDSRF